MREYEWWRSVVRQTHHERWAGSPRTVRQRGAASHMDATVLLIGVDIRFNIAFDAGFTLILTFPHQGGRG